jgi:hypothetical protein
VAWGWPGAVPVAGDYDGDGKSDFAVFDMATGNWYVLGSDQASVLVWNAPSDQPGALPAGGRY